MKRVLILMAIVVWFLGAMVNTSGIDVQAAEDSAPQQGEDELNEAFKTHRSDFQIQAKAIVIKMLPDDNNGSRHQRFIVKLNSGHTLLVAHNLDLSSRIDDLKEGDSVEFYGEYEWNKKGGVIHWTHHDPQGRHVAGWIRHDDKLYQ